MARKIPRRVVVQPLSEAMYRAALKSATLPGPYDVITAGYDRETDTLKLTLQKGISVSLPRAQIAELADAAPADIAEIEIQPGGDGISIRNLNVDIYVPGLLADELGPVLARALGRLSKGKTSEKKATASRLNGLKGGRPKNAEASPNRTDRHKD